MQRVLRGTSATISVILTDVDGAASPAAGAVTVGVVRADGTEVVPPGTATVDAGGGEYQYTLTAAQTATLDHLTATWTDAGDGSVYTTKVEVVGGFYFSIAEARATDKSMESPDNALLADMLATRQEVEDEFESICGVAFVPRFARVTIRSTARPLLLPHKRIRTLRSVTANGTPLTVTELADLDYLHGIITRRTFTWGHNVVVAYEHGYDAPPAALRRAAITRLRNRLFAARSGIPDRATSFSVTEGGVYRLSIPTAERTGIPDVDAVLDRYAERDIVVA